MERDRGKRDGNKDSKGRTGMRTRTEELGDRWTRRGGQEKGMGQRDWDRDRVQDKNKGQEDGSRNRVTVTGE